MNSKCLCYYLLAAAIFGACSESRNETKTQDNSEVQKTSKEPENKKDTTEFQAIPPTSGSGLPAKAALWPVQTKSTQHFLINHQKDTLIIGKSGTKIRIPAGCLVLASGNQVPGSIQIQLLEYYEPADMILAGLSTKAGDKILETSGMIQLTANSSGKPVKIKKGKSLEISFSHFPFNKQNEIYYGTSANQLVDWHLNHSQEPANATDPVDTEEGPSEIPHFKGDLDAYLKNNIFYPPSFNPKNLPTGLIYASFEVGTRGEISGLELRGGLHPELDKMVYYVIQNMPAWEPAYLGSKATKSFYQLPIPIGKSRWPTYAWQRSKALDILEKSENITVLYDKLGGSRFADKSGIMRSSNNPGLDDVLYTVNELGWINIDRLWELNTSTVNPTIPKAGLDNFHFALAFKRIRGIIFSTENSDAFVFSSIPEGEKGLILGFSIWGNQASFISKEIIIGQEIPEIHAPNDTISVLALQQKLNEVKKWWKKP